jgi:hypothetical protein
MLLFYQVVTRLSLTTCWQIVELQDDNKLLEQLVTSLLSSTTLKQVVNKPLTTCQQAGNKQCEHILLTNCWNSIATNLLHVWYNLCVLTRVPLSFIFATNYKTLRIMKIFNLFLTFVHSYIAVWIMIFVFFLVVSSRFSQRQWPSLFFVSFSWPLHAGKTWVGKTFSSSSCLIQHFFGPMLFSFCHFYLRNWIPISLVSELENVTKQLFY